MIGLRPKDLEKLSVLLGIPEETLIRMHSLGIINESMAMDKLIVYEFYRLKRTKLYKSKEIAEALSREYDVSKGKVLNAAYKKKTPSRHCRICGKPISKHRELVHDCLCENCVIDSITF